MNKACSPRLLAIVILALALVRTLYAQESMPEPAKDLISTNAQFQPPTNSIAPQGAVILWNGHDLTGWAPFFTNANLEISQLWMVTNAVLQLTGKPLGYLHTDETYGNYHLHAEWRWLTTNGNSGVFVHVVTNAIWPTAIECQLKAGNAGELLGLGGMTFDAPLIGGRNRAKVTTSTEHVIGEWNTYDIFCRGHAVETWVNGKFQNHVEKTAYTRGAIALQYEGRPVQFRNLWLTPL